MRARRPGRLNPLGVSRPQDLRRVEDRVSTLYVEKCHIDRDDNAVVLVNRERTVRVPAALVATVLIGPGTRITSGAVRLLADSGTAVCWVGDRERYARQHPLRQAGRAPPGHSQDN